MNYTHVKDGADKVLKRVQKRSKWATSALAIGGALYSVYRYLRSDGNLVEVLSPMGERMNEWITDAM